MSDENIIYDDENEAGGQEEPSVGSVVEAQIINYILQTRSLSIVTSNGLDSSYFTSYDEEFKFILDHEAKYRRVPDETTFLDKYPDFPCFDVNEAEQAMVFRIKEEKGYSLVATALREIDDVAKSDSIEAARLMKEKAEAILKEVSLVRFSRGMDIFKEAHIRYQEYLRRLELRGKIGSVFGIKSFDEETGGVWETDFVGIVGRPGEGKSWILEYLLLNPWQMQNKSVLLFSLENPKEVVGFRADSLLAHFSNFALMTGRDVVNWENGRPAKSTEDYREWIETISRSEVPFEVMDNSDSVKGFYTIEDIIEIVQERKPDIVGIDQLSLLAPSQRFKSIRESYIHITRTIRQAVNELHIPFYLNCQAGREAAKLHGKNKENTPELSHIAESDSVGQDATKILTIRNLDGILKISLKKNTTGRSNLDTAMAWDIDTGLLKPISAQDLENLASQF